ncbi:MAG: tryptophan--tRNA ligase [Thermosulfidibacteraceae bacterium]|jgi:tryptophanyl-tRNA synthetase
MKRVLSGIRPTGNMHLGNYMGAIKSWVELQKDFECFYFIADWHALTTEYEDPKRLKEYVEEVTLDLMASGINPEKSVIFLQSWVKEHAELHLLLSMITPLGWLERNPTYKEIKQELAHKELATYGFFGYPVLQAADILIYKAHFVPVGMDQLPHLELTREIARRFNYFYGECFPEPQAKLTETPKIPGVDGRKMSKSYNNAIYLSDSREEIWEKLRPMVTDTNRKRRSDPGDPDRCPVFLLHIAFTPEGEREEIIKGCKTASIGCIDCKKILFDQLMEKIGPIIDRRAKLSKNRDLVWDILLDGSKKAQEVARRTVEEVREKMGLNYRVTR